MEKYIAIIQTGSALPTVLKAHGDFDDMFINAMDINKNLVKTFRVFEKIEFPNPKNLLGLIITGSSAMVTEKHAWSEQTIAWLKSIIDLNIPTIGVCYGHQLLAQALGGKTNWNPKGREMGTVTLNLTNHGINDNLLKVAIDENTQTITSNATHLQSVTHLPKDVTLLATTKLDDNHCFRYKNHLWCLQFHPEFSTQIISSYIKCRKDDLVAEGFNPRQMIKSVKDNQAGINILKKFKEICLNY